MMSSASSWWGGVRSWLARHVFKDPMDTPEVRFLRGLCEKHTPSIRGQWLCSTYEFVFTFPVDGIRVTLKYNDVRDEWDLEIWCGSSGTHLFYYDCLDPRPDGAIDFMIERFGLMDQMRAAMGQRRGERERSRRAEALVVRRYSE